MSDFTADSSETCCLLERVRGGDEQAFEELFARHRSWLEQAIEWRLDVRLRARLDASDVVQETQLEAYRRLKDYLERRPMPFRIWLRKTAYERLLKIQRRHISTMQRSVARETPIPEQSSLLLARALMDGGSTPSVRVSRKEIAQRVRGALSELAALDREILFMRHFEALSYRDIGGVLDIDAATARKRYGRALLKLRQSLIDCGMLDPES